MKAKVAWSVCQLVAIKVEFLQVGITRYVDMASVVNVSWIVSLLSDGASPGQVPSAITELVGSSVFGWTELTLRNSTAYKIRVRRPLPT